MFLKSPYFAVYFTRGTYSTLVDRSPYRVTKSPFRRNVCKTLRGLLTQKRRHQLVAADCSFSGDKKTVESLFHGTLLASTCTSTTCTCGVQYLYCTCTCTSTSTPYLYKYQMDVRSLF